MAGRSLAKSVAMETQGSALTAGVVSTHGTHGTIEPTGRTYPNGIRVTLTTRHSGRA